MNIEKNHKYSEIADRVVPEYRDYRSTYSCTGQVAKRWVAAWTAACLANDDDPSLYEAPVNERVM